MYIFCNIYLVDKINNWYCRKFKEKFQLTTPYWSMISSLLHLVGLRPRVYYTLTNFRGGGGKAPLPPPPQYANGYTYPRGHSKTTSGTKLFPQSVHSNCSFHKMT